MYKIGFIGGGNMAFALAKAIKQAKLAKSLIISDKKKERLDFVRKELKVKVSSDNMDVISDADIIFLAVKPQIMDVVLDEIDGFVSDKQIIISIAAGVKLKKLESKLKNKKVIRVMPNTPCLVGEMAAGYAKGNKISSNDIKVVDKILNAAGKAYLMKEDLLDAVTGLSGSGPAFVARLIEAMVEGGVKSGLKKDIATELALQTFLGTAKLLQESKLSADDLVNMVSSPNGTTVAGRMILENSDVNDVLIKTIKRATHRSKELGKK